VGCFVDCVWNLPPNPLPKGKGSLIGARAVLFFAYARRSSVAFGTYPPTPSLKGRGA